MPLKTNACSLLSHMSQPSQSLTTTAHLLSNTSPHSAFLLDVSRHNFSCGLSWVGGKALAGRGVVALEWFSTQERGGCKCTVVTPGAFKTMNQ